MYGAYYPGYAYYGMSGGYVFTATLIVQDALHSQTVEVFALTQEHILAVADALQAQVADGIFVQLNVPLTIQDALHSQNAEGALVIGVLYREQADQPFIKIIVPVADIKNEEVVAGIIADHPKVTASREDILIAIKTQQSSGGVVVERPTLKVTGKDIMQGVIQTIPKPRATDPHKIIIGMDNDKPTIKR